MNKVRLPQRDRNYEKELHRNSEAENTITESKKFTTVSNKRLE